METQRFLIGCDHVDIGELKYARLLEAAAAMIIGLLFSGVKTYRWAVALGLWFRFAG